MKGKGFSVAGKARKGNSNVKQSYKVQSLGTQGFYFADFQHSEGSSLFIIQDKSSLATSRGFMLSNDIYQSHIRISYII